VDVDTYVGGRWRAAGAGVVDLGMVPAPAAADLLLDLAARVTGNAGDDLIFPATIADSAEVWPRLIGLARNDRVPRATRKNAVFWLGQAAGDRAVADLGGLVSDENEDREIQEQAVFALSQLRNGGGVPSLLEIARTHRDPKIRKTAMFWLGQSNDPRAIALFEEILRGR
jgi:HEAT repeat protein